MVEPPVMRPRTRLFADSGLLRRRGAAIALALIIELLLALLLFFLAPPLPGRKEASRTTVFGIEASKGEESTDKKPAEKRQQKAARARARAQPQTQPPPAPVPAPLETPAPVGPPTFLKLSRNDYQQGDIAKVPSRATDSNATDNETADAGGGGGAGDTPTLGRKGRHGETLYVAEWYREPRSAELQPYVNENRARYPGFGLVACRTVARYKVEDCYELDETRGTGFAGSVRQAAFQFLVRPPRVGKKLMVGEWVAIRIDYRRINRTPASIGPSGPERSEP
jgi:protein TonB